MIRAIFFTWDLVYNWYTRLTNRVYFSEEEIVYLIDVVDMWAEGHRKTADDAEDDEVDSLFENMSTAMDVREKLWRQLNG